MVAVMVVGGGGWWGSVSAGSSLCDLEGLSSAYKDL